VDKWKTKPFKVTGWIGISLILVVGLTDLFLAVYKPLPTLSQYVTHRWTAQPLFGWIMIGLMVWLGIHWFGSKK